MTPRVVLAAYKATVAMRYRNLRARLSRHRHQVTSAALVIAGAAGALGGGAIIGRWALGLVLLGESALAAWFGLMRDDGAELPVRGARTVEQVLEDERRWP